MDIIQFLKLIKKNILILILAPIIIAGLVYYGTKDQEKSYESTTIIYTGLSSGISLEAEANSRIDYSGAKMEFDNMMILFKSRETQQEVALSLFIQAMSLKTWDPQYISRQSFEEIHKLVPQYVKNMIVLPNKANYSNYLFDVPLIINDTTGLKNKQVIKKNKTYTVKTNETLFTISSKLGISASDLMNKNSLTSTNLPAGTILIFDQKKLIVFSNDKGKYDTIPLYIPDPSFYLTAEIDSISFARTLKKFKAYYTKDDTNYLYGLLNYSHKYYSLKAIDKVKTGRVLGSDLLELKYKTTDPGICKQTLHFYIESFKNNYKKLKESQSDNVVAYFEERVAETSINLQAAENRLLNFNQDNNIINYYEQTSHISQYKQVLDTRYYEEQLIFTAADSVLRTLDKQIAGQKGLAKLNNDILGYRNQISDITYKIAVNELNDSPDPKTIVAIEQLKKEQLDLRNKISENLEEVFGLQFSKSGVNSSEILTQWLNNLLIYEESKAKIAALKERRKEIQKTYEQFAPLGAKMARIEREINVYEQQYLSVLNSLNLAKLKQQSQELQSNIKIVDPPFFPLTPEASKRLLFVVAAGIIGFGLVLFIILLLEYLDNTLKNPKRAGKYISLELLSAYPLLTRKTKSIDFDFITNRVMEQAVQKIQSFIETENKQQEKPFNILIFSTQDIEGKSLIQDGLSTKLKEFGYKVLSANYIMPNYKPKFSFAYPKGDKPIYYDIQQENFNKSTISEILGIQKDTSKYDFVLIEIPSIIHYSYAPGLIREADFGIMVVRANRAWTNSDENSLTEIRKLMKFNPFLFLNGMQVESLETLIGELPRKRSKIRRFIKKLLKLQFFEQQSIK